MKITKESSLNSEFWLLRVERDGVDLREGIDVSPGDHVIGATIVLGYANGIIRGRVTVAGYDMPQGVRLRINAHHLGDVERTSDLVTEADERGQFVIEGLTSGEYDLSAGSDFISVPGARIPRLQPVTKRVTVTNGTESEVTLVVKPAERPKPG